MIRSKKPEKKEKVSTSNTRMVDVIEYKRGGMNAKCTKDMPSRILLMSRFGHTIEQMAKLLGVHFKTLERWLREKEEIREAYEKGKWEFDMAVEQALFEKARGFDYWEEKQVDGIDAIGRPYQYTTRTRKKVLADTTAIIFWLKNRQPERWRDAYNTGTGLSLTQINNTVNMDVFSDQEREMMRNMAIKSLANSNNVSRG